MQAKEIEELQIMVITYAEICRGENEMGGIFLAIWALQPRVRWSPPE